MDNLQPKSALYTDYKLGVHGAEDKNPILLQERQGLNMLNLVVFDDGAVNTVLQNTVNLSLPSPSQSLSNEQSTIMWIGPNRYLIVSINLEILKTIADQLEDQYGALQDLSCARTVIRIQGEFCRQIMAKGLNLPLDQDSFVAGQVVLSSFDHHYPAIVHNLSDERETFDIYVTRSFALSFWHWLCDSSLEYGYEIIESELNG